MFSSVHLTDEILSIWKTRPVVAGRSCAQSTLSSCFDVGQQQHGRHVRRGARAGRPVHGAQRQNWGTDTHCSAGRRAIWEAPCAAQRQVSFLRQYGLCEQSMKRDPCSLPFWYCPAKRASTMTCIVHSARDMHSFCSSSICSSPLSILFHHENLFAAEFMSGRHHPFCWLAASLHNPNVCRACLFQPTCFFSSLIGSPKLSPLVLLFNHTKLDLLVQLAARKEGQTSLLLLQFSWHYWSAAVLIILPILVICVQLPPTLLFA